jgi:hypothetical protein
LQHDEVKIHAAIAAKTVNHVASRHDMKMFPGSGDGTILATRRRAWSSRSPSLNQPLPSHA